MAGYSLSHPGSRCSNYEYEEWEYSFDRNLPPEQELMHFKAIVRSVMIDASKVLANIELMSHGDELEDQISLLDHYLD